MTLSEEGVGAKYIGVRFVRGDFVCSQMVYIHIAIFSIAYYICKKEAHTGTYHVHCAEDVSIQEYYSLEFVLNSS